MISLPRQTAVAQQYIINFRQMMCSCFLIKRLLWPRKLHNLVKHKLFLQKHTLQFTYLNFHIVKGLPPLNDNCCRDCLNTRTASGTGGNFFMTLSVIRDSSEVALNWFLWLHKSASIDSARFVDCTVPSSRAATSWCLFSGWMQDDEPGCPLWLRASF